MVCIYNGENGREKVGHEMRWDSKGDRVVPKGNSHSLREIIKKVTGKPAIHCQTDEYSPVLKGDPDAERDYRTPEKKIIDSALGDTPKELFEDEYPEVLKTRTPRIELEELIKKTAPKINSLPYKERLSNFLDSFESRANMYRGTGVKPKVKLTINHYDSDAVASKGLGKILFEELLDCEVVEQDPDMEVYFDHTPFQIEENFEDTFVVDHHSSKLSEVLEKEGLEGHRDRYLVVEKDNVRDDNSRKPKNIQLPSAANLVEQLIQTQTIRNYARGRNDYDFTTAETQKKLKRWSDFGIFGDNLPYAMLENSDMSGKDIESVAKMSGFISFAMDLSSDFETDVFELLDEVTKHSSYNTFKMIYSQKPEDKKVNQFRRVIDTFGKISNLAKNLYNEGLRENTNHLNINFSKPTLANLPGYVTNMLSVYASEKELEGLLEARQNLGSWSDSVVRDFISTNRSKHPEMAAYFDEEKGKHKISIRGVKPAWLKEQLQARGVGFSKSWGGKDEEELLEIGGYMSVSEYRETCSILEEIAPEMRNLTVAPNINSDSKYKIISWD